MNRVYSYIGPNGGIVIYPSTEAHYVNDLGEPCCGPPEPDTKAMKDPDDDYQRQNESLDEAADSLATILVCLLILAVFAIAAVILWLL